MQVTLQIDNLLAVQGILNTTGQKISNTTPLMKEIGNYLYNITRDSFDEEKDPNGRNWSPIKSTGYQSKYYSKMLYQEGDLQDKFIYEVSKDEIVIGTNANFKGFSYPAVHQFGTKDGKTPARAFMPITLDGKLYDDVENELGEIVVEFIESVLE
ncbi:MAG: phage virion morphogenesis protein [Arcobacter sp.]|uniref:phage virion morphogenesis protein n=1 Tax=Arcobacter sp. TaxID=1872629 RepID=UPI003D001474